MSIISEECPTGAYAKSHFTREFKAAEKTGKYPPPIYSVVGTEVSIFRISLTAALYYITLLVINENKILSRLLDIYRDPNKEDQNQT